MSRCLRLHEQETTLEDCKNKGEGEKLKEAIFRLWPIAVAKQLSGIKTMYVLVSLLISSQQTDLGNLIMRGEFSGGCLILLISSLPHRLK